MDRLIFFISLLNGLASFTVIFFLVRPYLAAGGRQRLLTAMLAVHLFRYLGMVGLLPGILDLSPLGVSRNFAIQMAYGDLVAGLLALASIVAIRRQASLATSLIWVFSIFGLLDLLIVGIVALPRLANPNILGPFGWILFTVYLPALILTHVLIIGLLLRGSRETSNEMNRARISQGEVG